MKKKVYDFKSVKDILESVVEDENIESTELDESESSLEEGCADTKKNEEDEEDTDKKEDDADDEDEDDEDMKENFNTHIEAITSLFEGQDLSEEAKTKIQTVVSVALSDIVKKRVAITEKKIVAELQEKYETIINDSLAELDEKVESYIDYVAQEYIKENELQIESGIRSELVESFLGGLKTLFNEHYVDIPEDKLDVVSQLASKVELAENRINTLINENLSFVSQISVFKKKDIINEFTNEMTDTDSERFASLCENVEYTDDESCRKSLEVIRDHYYMSSNKNNTQEFITEEVKDNNSDKMNQILAALKKNK